MTSKDEGMDTLKKEVDTVLWELLSYVRCCLKRDDPAEQYDIISEHIQNATRSIDRSLEYATQRVEGQKDQWMWWHGPHDFTREDLEDMKRQIDEERAEIFRWIRVRFKDHYDVSAHLQDLAGMTAQAWYRESMSRDLFDVTDRWRQGLQGRAWAGAQLDLHVLSLLSDMHTRPSSFELLYKGYTRFFDVIVKDLIIDKLLERYK